MPPRRHIAIEISHCRHDIFTRCHYHITREHTPSRHYTRDALLRVADVIIATRRYFIFMRGYAITL